MPDTQHAAPDIAVPRSLHIMAKPAGPRCNLSCDYCYYLEKQGLYPDTGRFRMKRAVLERFIRDYIASQAAAGQREIWFSWQGGEPTILGRGYFEDVIALQDRFCPPGMTVRNALQTNGTLLDADWGHFLRDHRFLVGISIDGPPHLHDRYRRDRRRMPTSDRVLAGLDVLQNHGVEVNALTVVNRHNVRRPVEVYRYLRGLGIEYLQFIPLFERQLRDGALAGPPGCDMAAAQPAPWSVRPLAYGDFLSAVFDEWVRRDVGRVYVQLFDVHLGIWLGHPAALCTFAETCGQALVLEHNGDLYACHHYVYPEHCLGNIMHSPLASLAALPRQRAFGADKRDRLPQGCHSCRWKFACHGGCPKHRVLATPGNDPERLNYFCDTYRRFFSKAAPYFEAMAALVRSGRPPAEVMALVAAADAGAAKTARNEPCPCGSGKKYKRCCLQNCP